MRCRTLCQCLPFLALAIVLALACPLTAWANGSFTSPCGTDNFIGPDSATLSCNVGGGATQNAISKGGGNAGLDNFINHISPVHYYGTSDAFAPGPVTFVTTTNPSWDVAQTGTYLRLDGIITLQGPSSSATISLRGHLGGPDLFIGPFTFGPLPADWTGGSIEYPLYIEQYGTQATAGIAVETLTLNIVGRARYDVDGSPDFLGANGLPEPTTGTLLCLELFGLWTARQRRRA
jgi:hypothetical protein